MKLILLATAFLISGCTTVDQIVCYGNGTCGQLDKPVYVQPQANNTGFNPTTVTTVITNRSTLVIVPNYAGGSFPSAVITSGK